MRCVWIPLRVKKPQLVWLNLRNTLGKGDSWKSKKLYLEDHSVLFYVPTTVNKNNKGGKLGLAHFGLAPVHPPPKSLNQFLMGAAVCFLCFVPPGVDLTPKVKPHLAPPTTPATTTAGDYRTMIKYIWRKHNRNSNRPNTWAGISGYPQIQNLKYWIKL